MKDKNIEVLIDRLHTFQMNILALIRENVRVIYFLIFLGVCSYGFELFNLNLTIDEEIHARYTEPVLAWIAQGRWGMYVLNKFLLPYTILPFVPLFTALVFHIAAIVFMLNAWDVKLGHREQIMAGSIALAFPTLAYMYAFSTINYGIGFGFLCIALSLYIYKEGRGAAKFLAVIPAAFAVAIYQGFIPALISVFLIYVINKWINEGSVTVHELLTILGVHLGAIAIYLCIHVALRLFVTFPESNYVSQYFGIQSLAQNFFSVLNRTFMTAKQVYFGDVSIYGIHVNFLPYLLGLSLIGLGMKIYASKASGRNKILLALLSLVLIVLPFSVGILLRGMLGMRFLVALPIVASGIIFLGSNNKNRLVDTAMMLLAIAAVFQFVNSTNHLFASSHVALQADRALASRLISGIELAKAEAGASQVRYLEVIGFLERQATPLMPKREIIGASFFEWDQGNPSRIAFFFQTLGYDNLQATPPELRIQMIEHADTMSVWPEKGSVKIVGDVVLLKFGPYSFRQKQNICSLIEKQMQNEFREFCE